MTVSGTTVAAMLVLSSVQTQPAAGQKRATAERPMPAGRGPMTIDVAGVRLGMPLAATQVALAATYRCETRRAASFRQLVDGEIARRRGVSEGFGPAGRAVHELTCEGPSGEYLRLFMAQTPVGEVVDRIDLAIPTDRVDEAQTVRQIEGRFGKPTEGTAANGSWCGGRCSYVGDLPKVFTSSSGRYVKIMGDRGGIARRADEAAVKAVAAREAPAAKRGAF